MTDILNSAPFVIWRGDLARRGWMLTRILEEPNYLSCTAVKQIAENHRAEDDLVVFLSGDGKEIITYAAREPEDVLWHSSEDPLLDDQNFRDECGRQLQRGESMKARMQTALEFFEVRSAMDIPAKSRRPFITLLGSVPA